MSKKKVMKQFSKIRLFVGDPQVKYLFRNSLSSFLSLRIFIITLYDVFVKIVYLKLEARFKHKMWFRIIQFCSNRSVLNMINKGKSVTLDSSQWHRILTREIELHENKTNNIEVKLASRYVPYNDELFYKSFPDQEDTFSVHRFKWLLILTYENPSQKTIDSGYDAIEKWIGNFKEASNPEVFESYSISDRLLNWLFFIIFTKKFSKKGGIFWQNLSRSYEFQLNHLISNLEYHWRYTNNHILNNARCLYICGVLLNIKQVKKIGQKILFTETDKMIKDGFLQEESSHYQMLLTRSCLEILYAAHMVKDNEMIKWIQPKVSKMLCVCDSLQSRFQSEEYPLFGDISPDIFPEWTLGWPFSCHSKKDSPWQKLFRMRESPNLVDPQLSETADNEVIKNKWHYLSNRNFEAWIYTKNRNGVSHGHADNGSLVIFYKGNPILIDLGRYNYIKDYRNFFQCSQEGHNIPTIDNLLFDSFPSTLFKTNRFSSKCDIVELTDNLIDFVLISFDKQIRLNRKIVLHDDAVVIEDKVERANSKTKKIEYTNNWYVGSECNIRDIATLMKFSNNPPLEFTTHASEYPVRQVMTDASRCARYGELSQACRLRIFTSVYLNQQVRTVLQDI